jgi:hypothetical protein
MGLEALPMVDPTCLQIALAESWLPTATVKFAVPRTISFRTQGCGNRWPDVVTPILA